MAEAESVVISNGGPVAETTDSEIKDGVQLSELPQNILQMIFTYLDLRSKTNVVLVCKKWRDVAYEKVVWRNAYANVYLDRITNRKVFASFEARGIQRIEVAKLAEPGSNKLRIMLRNVPSLLELKIWGYGDLIDKNLFILHKFPDLRTLDLYNSYTITDAALEVVGRSLRELTTLSLCDCFLITDEGISHLTGTSGTHGSLKIKNLSLTSCSKITDESPRMIATKLLELTKLDLKRCIRITDTGVIFLAGGTDDVPGNCKLEELDLSEIYRISDISLQKLASGLPVLKTLNLSGNREWTELAFTYLAKMTNLKKLTMTYCGVMNEWLLHLVGSTIKILRLSENEDIRGEGIRHIARMSYLQHLDLSWGGIDDEGLECLSRCKSKLFSLNLLENDSITDAGMVHIAKIAHLTDLNLSFCQNITSAGLLQLSELGPPTLQLKFRENFEKTLERINLIIGKFETNDIGTKEWLKAIRTISKLECMLALELQPLIQPDG